MKSDYPPHLMATLASFVAPIVIGMGIGFGAIKHMNLAEGWVRNYYNFADQRTILVHALERITPALDRRAG